MDKKKRQPSLHQLKDKGQDESRQGLLPATQLAMLHITLVISEGPTVHPLLNERQNSGELSTDTIPQRKSRQEKKTCSHPPRWYSYLPSTSLAEHPLSPGTMATKLE